MSILKDTLAAIKQQIARSNTIISKLKGVGIEGTRLAPASSSRTDAQIGGRLDWGKSFIRDGKKYQNVNLQLNKAANKGSIRELVKKNGTHTKYAEAAVLVEEPKVPVEKIENGKKVKLSDEEIEAAKRKVLEDRRDRLIRDLGAGL